MLRYYPVAYRDELLYSQIARYHRHTCSPGYKQTLSELFGSRTVAAVVDLPAHLEQLHQHVGHITRQAASDLLRQQTLFPAFEPFLGLELAEKVKNSMLSSYGGDIHTRAGLSASGVKRPAALRICPDCFAEQISQNGEAYWQRLFQIAGVLVCPLHGCSLSITPVPYVPINKHEYTAVTPPAVDKQQAQFTSSDKDKLILIAKDFQHLLENRHTQLSHAQWTSKYRGLLKDRQFTSGKRVNQIELAEGFVAFWGAGVLAALSSSITKGDEHSWLTAMARKHRKNVHPVRHILFYRYLSGIDAPLADLFKLPAAHRGTNKQRCDNKKLTSVSAEDRQHWLNLQKLYPDLYAKKLRQQAPALYARLYRQDREWLFDHTPYEQCHVVINRRVDWASRDRSLARRIIRQSKQLRKGENRPRCSAKLMAQRAGCLSMVEKHLKKLPLTRKVLKKYSETIAEYQHYRIDCVVSRMLLDQEPLLSWKIYRRANIRAGASQEVKNYIKEKVDEFVGFSKVSSAPQG